MDIVDKLVERFPIGDSERKLVFWYETNPERDLEPIREALRPLGVEVWELTGDNHFTTKYQLEVAAPQQSFLVYARFPEPDRRKNWLLDIQMYSEKFEADDIALLMQRFHVEHLAVRDFFQKHRRFFNSSDRVKKLEAILPPEPSQEQLSLGMLAVLAGTLSPQPRNILRQVLVKGGDNQKSEHYAFRSVGDALRELEGSIGRLFGTYGVARIIVTSDHGFLYQATPLESTEKADRVEGNIFSGNRRYALGRGLSLPAGARKLSLAYLGVEEEAVIAAGLNRFASGGGARFVHGGALPQESILPLIICRNVRGVNRRTGQKLVEVRLANRERLVTDYRFKAAFFQDQKVDEEYRPRRLRV